MYPVSLNRTVLDLICLQIKATNAEINQLVEKRMMSGDPTDDKLSLFRQQVHTFSSLSILYLGNKSIHLLTYMYIHVHRGL